MDLVSCVELKENVPENKFEIYEVTNYHLRFPDGHIMIMSQIRHNVLSGFIFYLKSVNEYSLQLFISLCIKIF